MFRPTSAPCCHRFNALVSEKAAVSTDLMISEEERLNVSKNLIDLQIENNHVREAAERAEYDQANMIMTLEDELLEIRKQLDETAQAHEAARVEANLAETERRELADECALSLLLHLSCHFCLSLPTRACCGIHVLGCCAWMHVSCL